MKQKRGRGYDDDDDYYDEGSLALPSITVHVDEYVEDEIEDTGLLDRFGRAVVRRHVAPKRQPAGFVWFADEDEEESDGDE